MKFHRDIEQGSPEWLALRRGRITSTDASNLLTPTGRPSASAAALRGRVLAEKLDLQDADPTFLSEWMSRGLGMEEEARRWFSFETGLTLEIVGFVEVNDWVGFSPDALASETLCMVPLELKCPKPSTHLKWLEAGVLPPEHVGQVHFAMACMEAPFGYFTSYCPGLPAMILQVLSDDYTAAMAEAIEACTTILNLQYLNLTPKGAKK